MITSNVFSNAQYYGLDNIHDLYYYELDTFFEELENAGEDIIHLKHIPELDFHNVA